MFNLRILRYSHYYADWTPVLNLNFPTYQQAEDHFFKECKVGDIGKITDVTKLSGYIKMIYGV